MDVIHHVLMLYPILNWVCSLYCQCKYSVFVSLVSSQGVFPVVGGVALFTGESLDLDLLLLGVGVVYLYLILIAVFIEGVQIDLMHLPEVLPQLAHVVKLGAADFTSLLLLLLLDVHLRLEDTAVN